LVTCVDFPIIDLNAPTDLAFEWGWLLATLANAIVLVLLVGVFVLGAVVRLPRARRDLEAVERASAADANQRETRQ
jgi:uncharacterized membrane protein